ncbi:MAG: DUF5057 domain-containing protein [Lachnospiraceae bacterium]|nr:DUF5057 domain-containing protein [Lachnospiraceae bacterium]
MKKIMKKRKKFIFAAVALLVIAGILTLDLGTRIVDVEARQNIFEPVYDYSTNGITILEIVPDGNDPQSMAEMGYFVPNTNQGNGTGNANQGYKRMSDASIGLNGRYGLDDDDNTDNHVRMLIQMRRYGMIKYLGLDSVDTSGVSENPIYTDRWATFVNVTAQGGYIDLPATADASRPLIQGHYVIDLTGSAAYKLNDNYVLGDGTAQDGLFDENGNPIPRLEANYFYEKVIITGGNSNGTSEENPTEEVESNDDTVTPDEENDADTLSIPEGDAEADAQAAPVDGAAQEIDSNTAPADDLEEEDPAAEPDDTEDPAAEPDDTEDPAADPEDPAAPEVDPGDSDDGDDGEKIGYKKYIQPSSGLPAAVTYVGTGGDLRFSYILNQADIYQGYSENQYKYLGNREPSNGWFKNGNWFREYVLGDARTNSRITYNVVGASNVTPDMIDNADLVYISGTSAEYIANGQDLSEAAVMELYNKTTQGTQVTKTINGVQREVTIYKAIMMDYLAYSGQAAPVNNIDKLAFLTWQENQKGVPSIHANFAESTGEMLSTAALADASLWTDLRSGMLIGYNGNFAVNNIYVYDHHWQDFQNSLLQYEQVDAHDNFANGDFHSAYTAAAATTGFSNVLAYIKLNNLSTSLGHVAEGIVTPALAIQYILSYRGEDLGLIKSEYSVLEIQPTKEFLYNKYNESLAYGISEQWVQKNRDEFIETFLGEELTKGGRQEYVAFTSMTIDEFNTRQEDLLATYDIIYIGDEHSAYYASINGASYDLQTDSTNLKASIPYQYNDTSMYGMIYYNLGDKETTADIRYSSRDLTKAKLKELKHYLDNNSLIIVGEELMSSRNEGNVLINPTRVENVTGATIMDAGRVDTSSNLYELLAYGRGSIFDTGSAGYTNLVDGDGIGAKSNLVSERDVKNIPGGRLALSTYLSRSRLTIDLQKQPIAYNYGTDANGAAATATYLERDRDGKYYLTYEFSIINSEVDAALGQTYSVHFYQDVNADGRFGETEEKTDIKIRDIASGEAALSTTVDGVTTYNLYSGVIYELVREVPSDEGGIISWCLKVEKSTDRSIYATETGYTAIKPMNRRILNILQITDTDHSALNLELMPKDSAMGRYLYAPVVLDQYDINIRTITVDQFEKDLAAYLASSSSTGFGTVEARYLNYFATFQREEAFYPGTITALNETPMNVNMLILGFGDTMEGFSAQGIGAIKAYVNAGKPVLTSNSVVTQNVNTDLANLFGVDRYGYYSALYSSLDKTIGYTKAENGYALYATRRESAGNAVGYVPDTIRGTMAPVPQGITNTIIRSQYRTGGAGTPTYLNSATVNAYVNGSTINGEYMYVDRMNQGQISNFPYTISEHVKIRKSKAQDFQLDLDTDADNDLMSDTIAWFTLSAMSNEAASFDVSRGMVGAGTGNVYIETPGDGINNYYIYNSGNVTYTGIGYYGSSFTAGEAQLFVNTLIAAYEAGFTNPIVNFYQTNDVNDGKLDSIAVPYDGNITRDNAVDSSIIYDEATRKYLYQFVNPNTDANVNPADCTKGYFKITDSNFVKGEKVATVAFYLGVTGKKGDTIRIKDGPRTYEHTIEEITLEDNTVVQVVRITMFIYDAEFKERIGSSSVATSAQGTNPELKVGVMYGFYAPMSYLEEMGAARIYIQANTGYKTIDDTGKDIVRPLGTDYDMFTEIKQELLKLD